MKLDFEETRDLWKKFEELRPHFSKGGRFERLYPLFEAKESFLFVLPHTAKGRTHVRDAMDIKRLMSTVIVALLPCILWGIWNVGYQKLVALGQPHDLLACFGHGLWHVVPIILVSYLVGGLWEVTFAIVRKHEINEGFLVTGMLFPLVCPPTLPLWMVAMSITFGTVIGKEVFGTTVEFREGEVRAGYREDVDIVLPLPGGATTGPGFLTYVGFQLTAAELEHNRQRRQ